MLSVLHERYLSTKSEESRALDEALRRSTAWCSEGDKVCICEILHCDCTFLAILSLCQAIVSMVSHPCGEGGVCTFTVGDATPLAFDRRASRWRTREIRSWWESSASEVFNHLNWGMSLRLRILHSHAHVCLPLLKCFPLVKVMLRKRAAQPPRALDTLNQHRRPPPAAAAVRPSVASPPDSADRPAVSGHLHFGNRSVDRSDHRSFPALPSRTVPVQPSPPAARSPNFAATPSVGLESQPIASPQRLCKLRVEPRTPVAAEIACLPRVQHG